jgi:hypothetical protein
MEADKSDSSVGRRCSICGITWPRQFKKCYECGGATDIGKVTPTLTVEEATSKQRHFEFEEYLEKREGAT